MYIRSTHLEYSGVEDDHDEAWEVEGGERGPDDKVGVVEGAYELATPVERMLLKGRGHVFTFEEIKT